MSTLGAALATAVTLIWLGMVVAISFLEAPLKFTAPGVTLPIGLAIGRKVFRALNSIEAALAVVLVVALALDGSMSNHTPLAVWVASGIAILALIIQLVAVRPGLTKRSNEVLAGDGTQAQDSRSHAHFYYVGFEVLKVIALIVGTVGLLMHG
ncbi:hypothetical protein HH308_00040 [Gordonia sp. TBRC 11910]|uniref:DUF4149 domain-containing protein n=1 Tax=Gordonia asplenii TaxID=2725283 RepID=A0A848KVW8_9ACTN|nr:hypothetical protein [Gordonia asplenii]NMN99607.1 hypothetical protein [Gordonia asplenii]